MGGRVPYEDDFEAPGEHPQPATRMQFREGASNGCAKIHAEPDTDQPIAPYFKGETLSETQQQSVVSLIETVFDALEEQLSISLEISRASPACIPTTGKDQRWRSAVSRYFRSPVTSIRCRSFSTVFRSTLDALLAREFNAFSDFMAQGRRQAAHRKELAKRKKVAMNGASEGFVLSSPIY
jgi:hypothetical protein